MEMFSAFNFYGASKDTSWASGNGIVDGDYGCILSSSYFQTNCRLRETDACLTLLKLMKYTYCVETYNA